jgi:signal transduction histidine kinase
VLANLLGNAIDASPVGGKISIRLRPGTRGDVKGFVLTIHDQGPGIPLAIRDRILEPFFTTKELKGTGLGLWLAKSIIQKHEGTLRFRSNCSFAPRGTCFRIFLPEKQSAESEVVAEEKQRQPVRIDQKNIDRENVEDQAPLSRRHGGR